MMQRSFGFRGFLSALTLSATLALVGCSSSAPKKAPPPPVQPLAISADEITIEQLARLLPRHAITVGFDVDDTLIFSAPAFNALQPEYDPRVIRPRNYNDLTPADQAKYHEFWNRLNTEYDNKSTPKEFARRLLALHMQRGDDIWIISKRQGIDLHPSTAPTTEPTTASVAAPTTMPIGPDLVTQRYERMFHVHFAHPVVQTQLKDKTPFISGHHIEYYYGDSDSDIASTIAAGAVPIRVKRGSGSYATDVVHNGQLGEAVLAGSDQ